MTLAQLRRRPRRVLEVRLGEVVEGLAALDERARPLRRRHQGAVVEILSRPRTGSWRRLGKFAGDRLVLLEGEPTVPAVHPGVLDHVQGVVGEQE